MHRRTVLVGGEFEALSQQTADLSGRAANASTALAQFLTENEIAAAKLASQGETFNPQQQYPVTWPDEPVVARAYIDQLQRKAPMDEAQLAPLMAALEAAEAGDTGAAARLESLAAGMSEGDPLVGKLAETLRGIAGSLRSGG